MKTSIFRSKLLFAFTLLIISVIQASAQSTAFTYQGKLSVGGSAATGNFDMRFTLEDVDGFELGTPVTIPSVAVAQGIFTVQLDFGSTYFDQSDRFLKIEIRQAGNPMPPPFTLLTPRQQITPAPKAVFSNASSFAVSSANALQLGGVAASQYVQKNASGEIVAPRLENLAADPAPASAANAGRIYFNTTDNAVKVSNGAAWVSLSPPAAPPPPQTFSGRVAEFTVRCDQPHVIRSISFTKQSAASRLRITYRDKAKTAGSSDFFTTNVDVRIDGTSVSSLITLFDAENSPSGGFPFWGISSPFVSVGIVENIAAGTHTLTSVYVRGGSNPPIVCFVTNNPYFIEIEEIP